MGYLNKICEFISSLCTIWKLKQHTTKGKNPLSTKDIVHFCYYDIHIFHHSNPGVIKFRSFPLYSTLWILKIVESKLTFLWVKDIPIISLFRDHFIFTSLIRGLDFYSWILFLYIKSLKWNIYFKRIFITLEYKNYKCFCDNTAW